jgi:hypothetical protein
LCERNLRVNALTRQQKNELNFASCVIFRQF